MSAIHPSHSCSNFDIESQLQAQAQAQAQTQTQTQNDITKHESFTQIVEAIRDDLQSDAEIYSVSNLGNVLVQSWTNGADPNPSYVHMNLPPLVNCDTTGNSEMTPTEITLFFKKYKGFLTFLNDLGGIIGSMFFSVGSIMGYGFVYGYSPQSCGLVTCSWFQSLMSLTGAIFFFITPISTFILIDAVSFTDTALSWNSSLYIIGGFLYILGALAYLPFGFIVEDTTKVNTAYIFGASIYSFASMLYVVAVLWDMIRARNLKEQSQIGFLTFIIESWVSATYLTGSLLLLMGSIFSYPALYTPHIYAMFLAGSFCFTIGSVSGFTAQLWRYARNAVQRNKLLRQKIKLLESIKRTTSSMKKLSFARSHSSPNLAVHGVVRQISFSKSSLLSTHSLQKPNANDDRTQTPTKGNNQEDPSASSIMIVLIRTIRQFFAKLLNTFPLVSMERDDVYHSKKMEKKWPTKLNPTRIAVVSSNDHINRIYHNYASEGERRMMCESDEAITDPVYSSSSSASSERSDDDADPTDSV